MLVRVLSHYVKGVFLQMKVSFPHMGQTTAYRKLVEFFGHEVIMPERPTQRTFDLGVLHSPEFICYPAKVMAGTYIEACQRGAEVIISSGGSGPCRAGMYCEVHRRILKKLGYDTEIIIFDSMFKAPVYFLKQLIRVINGRPLHKVLHYGLYVIKMMEYLDNIEKIIKVRRAYEINKGDFDRTLSEINNMFYETSNKKELKKAYVKALSMIDAVPIKSADEDKKLRIGIIGEIFVVMDSATNMNIEARLNSLGAEVESCQYISDWIYHNVTPSFLSKDKTHRMHIEGAKYTTCNCGGHHLGNIGWIEDYAKRDFDGIIHLMPFGCLPELVTRSMSHKLSEQFDIPILTMSIDEQNGEANTQTRLEAFVDLCAGRKKKKQNSKDTDKKPKAEREEALV